MALEKMNSTVNKFITDVLQFVIRNPHHVVRLQTTRINIICSGKELLRMLQHPAVVTAFTLAGVTAYPVEGKYGAVEACIGFTEALAEWTRRYVDKHPFPEKITDIFEDADTITFGQYWFQSAYDDDAEYAKFMQGLQVGDVVRCTVNGTGIVRDVSFECAENETLSKNQTPVFIVRVKFAHREEDYTCDGSPISIAYIGRTLRPVTVTETTGSQS